MWIPYVCFGINYLPRSLLYVKFGDVKEQAHQLGAALLLSLPWLFTCEPTHSIFHALRVGDPDIARTIGLALPSTSFSEASYLITTRHPFESLFALLSLLFEPFCLGHMLCSFH